MTTIEQILADRPPGSEPNGTPQPAGRLVVNAYQDGLIQGNEQTLYVIAVLLHRLHNLEDS